MVSAQPSSIPFVDLGQERVEHALLETLALVDVGDERAEILYPLILVVAVELVEFEIDVHLLHLGLLLGVLAAVIGLENLELVWRGAHQGLVDQPRALVVLDVGADLADDLGPAEVVQVVVLDLEVLAQRDEDLLGLRQVRWRGQVE